MKLYGSYTSPFVRHCRIVLLETAQACEFILTDSVASAAQSPTMRVPFLEDGQDVFSDSSAILKHLREKVGQTFCASSQELNLFCLVNTALDSTVNVFFLERDGVNVNEVPYLQRQIARIEASLKELDNLTLPISLPYNDAELRLACFIGWAKLRNRAGFSEVHLSPFNNLENFYASAKQCENFKLTEPNA